MKKFISTERKGFKMTFNNGLTISVQWGTGNYCENKPLTLEELERTDFSCTTDMESNTAEIAIMIDDVIIKPSLILDIGENNSYSLGYLSPEEVLNYMLEVRRYDVKAVNDIKAKIYLSKNQDKDLLLYPPINV